jgi:hypothetical protein
MEICCNIRQKISDINLNKYKEDPNDPEVQRIELVDPLSDFKFVECGNYFCSNGFVKFDLI